MVDAIQLARQQAVHAQERVSAQELVGRDVAHLDVAAGERVPHVAHRDEAVLQHLIEQLIYELAARGTLRDVLGAQTNGLQRAFELGAKTRAYVAIRFGRDSHEELHQQLPWLFG